MLPTAAPRRNLTLLVHAVGVARLVLRVAVILTPCLCVFVNEALPEDAELLGLSFLQPRWEGECACSGPCPRAPGSTGSPIQGWLLAEPPASAAAVAARAVKLQRALDEMARGVSWTRPLPLSPTRPHPTLSLTCVGHRSYSWCQSASERAVAVCTVLVAREEAGLRGHRPLLPPPRLQTGTPSRSDPRRTSPRQERISRRQDSLSGPRRARQCRIRSPLCTGLHVAVPHLLYFQIEPHQPHHNLEGCKPPIHPRAHIHRSRGHTHPCEGQDTDGEGGQRARAPSVSTLSARDGAIC